MTMSLEERARRAEQELAITAEARSRARALAVEEAVAAAASNEREVAFFHLLRAVALDQLEMMVRVPIDDLAIARAAAIARGDILE